MVFPPCQKKLKIAERFRPVRPNYQQKQLRSFCRRLAANRAGIKSCGPIQDWMLEPKQLRGQQRLIGTVVYWPTGGEKLLLGFSGSSLFLKTAAVRGWARR